MPTQIGISISLTFSVLLMLAGMTFLLYGFGLIHQVHLKWTLHQLLRIKDAISPTPIDDKSRGKSDLKSAKNLGIFLLVAGAGILGCMLLLKTPSDGSSDGSGKASPAEEKCSSRNPAIDVDDPLFIDTAVAHVKLPGGADIGALRDSEYERQIENLSLFGTKLRAILKKQGIDDKLLANYGISLSNMIIPYCACYQKQGHDSNYALIFKVVYDFRSIDDILIPVLATGTVSITINPIQEEPLLSSYSGFPVGNYELNAYQKLKIGQLARGVINEVIENKQPKTITCKGFTDASPFERPIPYSGEACIQDICQPVLWGDACGGGRSLRSIGIGNNKALSFARGYAGIAFFIEMIRSHDPSGKTTKLLKFEYTGCDVGSERGDDHENRRIIFEIK